MQFRSPPPYQPFNHSILIPLWSGPELQAISQREAQQLNATIRELALIYDQVNSLSFDGFNSSKLPLYMGF